ncbi:27 kDa hemolymph glycoprotein-like [Leptopilina heterotoma]|uniref:27 kDa hemolymph glycoprotein-like n=1 Tax=Leptopilina heterotoma TaxID=63436 RepID=UPI001CA8AC83|nr:27 kDa hemolymph glycoprotein-like [Leptopilina heterotoma]
MSFFGQFVDSTKLAEKCFKNVGPSGLIDLKHGTTKMKDCFVSLIDVDSLSKHTDIAKRTGDVENIISRYFQKSEHLKNCFLHYTNVLEPCLDPSNKEFSKILVNIANAAIDYIFVTKKRQAASLISSDCFEKNFKALKKCVKHIHETNFENIVSIGSVEICSDITKLRDCLMNELKTCDNPQPATFTSGIFNSALRAAPCDNMFDERQVIVGCG